MPPGAAAGPDGRAGPHVFVADVDQPVLDSGDHHHLARVLRLRDGDALTVSDGAGRWRPCRFGASLEPSGDIVEVPEPLPTLTLGFALTKGAKPELVVQKLTELGIDVIVPFVAARSVVRWDRTKAERNRQRLVRVAREAAMQCRRVWLPDVAPVGTLATFATIEPPPVRADPGGGALGPTHHTVLIGPEGGWDHGEGADLDTVELSPHVLRAETAAIAAATLMVDARRRPRPA